MTTAAVPNRRPVSAGIGPRFGTTQAARSARAIGMKPELVLTVEGEAATDVVLAAIRANGPLLAAGDVSAAGAGVISACRHRPHGVRPIRRVICGTVSGRPVSARSHRAHGPSRPPRTAGIAEGKRAMARKDFQKVLAENANYPGLVDHLVAVGE